MRPFFHRYLLPPILLGLHAALFLPLFLARPLEHPGDEYGPPSAWPPAYGPPPPPPSPPRTPFSGPGSPSTGDPDERAFVDRLEAKFSVPFGILGFLVIYVVKQVAGQVPLPRARDARSTRLAVFIECAVLFFTGVAEEIWRWGLVRILVKLEGGEGGFRGRGELWDLAAGVPAGGRRDVVYGALNTKYPSIWEGVYFMGWTWSLVECVASWWSMRPVPATPASLSAAAGGRRHSRADSSVRRPLLGKRVRSDYSTMTSDEPAAGSFQRKKRGPIPSKLQHSQSQSQLQSSEQHQQQQQQQHSQSQSSTLFSSTYTPTAVAGPSTPSIPETPETDTPSTIRPQAYFDLEAGSSVDPLETPPPPAASSRRGGGVREDDDEDDDGDDEGSLSTSVSASVRSESTDTRSEAEGEAEAEAEADLTPLLSSSLPYDPAEQHPHHEQQAALHTRYRQASYSTLTDSIAASASVVGSEDTAGGVEIHHSDFYPSDLEQGLHYHHQQYVRTDTEAESTEHERASQSTERGSGRRVRASYSGSSSYTPPPPPVYGGHAYFPVSTATTTAASTTGHGADQASSSSPTTPAASASASSSRHRSRLSRRIYGVSVNSLPEFYPVLWRSTALLSGVSHCLLFAWAPALVFAGSFQWWCFLVLVLLTGKKGWYTMEWYGGGASRDGLLKVSVMMFCLSIITYVFSLAVWGLLW